ncbi:MAG TPA: hypothetical protein VHS32_20135, partial [Streptosporangiaceae bacterium]|nr:hypothetical protein [Streptosporangiaceae bacterium]
RTASVVTGIEPEPAPDPRLHPAGRGVHPCPVPVRPPAVPAALPRVIAAGPGNRTPGRDTHGGLGRGGYEDVMIR